MTHLLLPRSTWALPVSGRMREEAAAQRNTKFHHKDTKDTKVLALRCNSDFNLSLYVSVDSRAFGVTNHVTTTSRSSGRKSPRKSVKSVHGGMFKPNNLSGLKPSCPSCLCGEYSSVFSVSLADVALALLIVFFICRAKSALW